MFGLKTHILVNKLLCSKFRNIFSNIRKGYASGNEFKYKNPTYWVIQN